LRGAKSIEYLSAQNVEELRGAKSIEYLSAQNVDKVRGEIFN